MSDTPDIDVAALREVAKYGGFGSRDSLALLDALAAAEQRATVAEVALMSIARAGLPGNDDCPTVASATSFAQDVLDTAALTDERKP